MEMHLPFETGFLVFLVVTAVLVPLFARLRLNPVLGFLVAGVVLGPYGLGRLAEFGPPFLSHIVFDDVKGVSVFAELGVIFLLFTIGLELSPHRLWTMRRMVFGLGSAQIVLSAAIIGGLAYLWGNAGPAAAVIGCALALSSTAMVMKILMDRQQFASPVGQTAFPILLMQDLAVVPMLFMVAMLGDAIAPGADTSGGVMGVVMPLVMALGRAALVIAGIIALGRFVVRPVLRFVASAVHGPEFFMAQILLIVIAASWATGAAGLSMALGAFLAGLVLAETEFRNQVEVDIEPFKGMLLGLFFMSVGMQVDMLAVADNLAWLGASVLGLLAIKSGVIVGLCRLWRVPLPTSVRAGLSLGQGGEFAFVLFGLAMANGVLPSPVGHFMLMLTSMTMLLTPAFFALGDKVGEALTKRGSQGLTEVMDGYAATCNGHVVIAGFGRTGQAIADVMEKNQIPYVALDHQPEHLDALRRAGKPVYYGDASNAQSLERVNATQARAIILAMDSKKASRMAIENIRRCCTEIPIYARARDAEHGAELKKLGVDDVVLETVEMSLQLAGRVLQRFDFTPAAAGRVIGNEREDREDAVAA